MQQPGKLYVINPAYAEAEVTAMCLQGLKKRWSPPACACVFFHAKFNGGLRRDQVLDADKRRPVQHGLPS